MIDIAKLKKHPLSFRLFEQWVEKNQETVLSLYNGTTRNEDVVCCLDEHLVFTNVAGFKDFWWYNINLYEPLFFDKRQSAIIPNSGSCKSRKEAIEQAIEVAFGLLEQKLKTN